ncbi:hypothetical protein BHE74_00041904 [Ensete ventricosum]|nr:hypothetical protein BHE74_00041904 [Ensete ventricosum]
MVWVFLVPRPGSDLGVTVTFQSLLHYGSRIGFARKGAVTSRSGHVDNNIDLFLYGPFWVRECKKSFLSDLEKNLCPSIIKRGRGGLGNGGSGLSILLLEGPEGCPQGCSLSQSSSLDLTNPFWTLSSLWFTCSCTLNEFVESEERVPGSGARGAKPYGWLADRAAVMLEVPDLTSLGGCCWLS